MMRARSAGDGRSGPDARSAGRSGDRRPGGPAPGSDSNADPDSNDSNAGQDEDSGGSAPPSGQVGPGSQKRVLEPAEIRRALTRIAHEILERTNGADDVLLLGIPTRGVPLARRLAERAAEFEDRVVPWGSLDVTMYRDDLRLRPARALGRTELPPAGIDGKTVVIVDDVLYSGRTVRAALDALTDLGRPRAVQRR